MVNSLAANELLWEEQRRTNKTQTDLDRRQWMKNFALVFALIVLTIGIATVLARLSAAETSAAAVAPAFSSSKQF